MTEIISTTRIKYQPHPEKSQSLAKKSQPLLFGQILHINIYRPPEISQPPRKFLNPLPPKISQHPPPENFSTPAPPQKNFSISPPQKKFLTPPENFSTPPQNISTSLKKNLNPKKYVNN